MKAAGRLRKFVGRFVRRLRNAVETQLHPGRHRAITKRLEQMPRPQSVVVICYGNICRSPYLEAVLRRALPEMRISSAGFVGAGRTVPANSAALATQRGLDLSAHRSRLITADILEDGDLLIVMDADQAEALARGFGVPRSRIVIAGDLDPIGGAGRAILDPWGQTVDVFASSFDRLDRVADRFVSLMRRGS